EVKIIDFGIAKSEAQEHKTETGTIKGKFVYMSPEQSAAKPVDKRSDIFSVGICLYEALAGRNPFVRNHVVASIDAIHRDTPPPLADIDPSLAIFDPIVSRALAKSADERYSDCLELRDALMSVRASVPAPARPLAQTMAAVFAEEIAYERQIILDSGRLKTEQIAQMRQSAEDEHRSGVSRRITTDRSRAAATRDSSQRLQAQRDSSDHPRSQNLADSSDRLQQTDRARSAQRLMAASEPAGTAHSRLPFAVALGLIILMSATAAAAVFKWVERRRLGLPVESVTSLWKPSPAPVAKPKPPPEPPVAVPPPQPPPAVNKPTPGEESVVASADD
ncbi:MAG: protein kinase, partial [Deltaproteobacteria bacterium]|nr:protein kinase [Deltaproteobacteria bacterium]